MGINERIDKLQNRLDFFYDKDIAFQIDMLKAIRAAREDIHEEMRTLDAPSVDNECYEAKHDAYQNSLKILDGYIEAVESKYE